MLERQAVFAYAWTSRAADGGRPSRTSLQPSPRSLPNVDLLSVVLGFGVLLISLTIHEAAHALTADRLGDPTARSARAASRSTRWSTSI